MSVVIDLIGRKSNHLWNCEIVAITETKWLISALFLIGKERWILPQCIGHTQSRTPKKSLKEDFTSFVVYMNFHDRFKNDKFNELESKTFPYVVFYSTLWLRRACHCNHLSDTTIHFRWKISSLFQATA